VQGSGVYGLQAARVMMPASWVLAGVLACDQPGCGPDANNTGGEGRAQVGVEGFQDLGVGKAAAISAAAEESAGTVRESEVSKFTGLVMSATTRPAAELVGALGVDFSDAGWGVRTWWRTHSWDRTSRKVVSWPKDCNGQAVGVHAGRIVYPALVWLATQDAIWVREVKPNLASIRSMCRPTVLCESTSSAAISLLLRPWATRAATCASRSVRCGPPYWL
jgi:hypothetical protein